MRTGQAQDILKLLNPEERAQLKRIAAQAGMSVEALVACGLKRALATLRRQPQAARMSASRRGH
ncbi:MAG: hypothetical protein QN144_14345 [Armatimonadota bacterium]|nr:hypothetical protein [Armatimonadota bacterium]